jgi:predicted Zn-dependent peptidase
MIREVTLDNGVRIALEKMDSVRSCAIGVWLKLGSQNEVSGEYGLAHFIEHMLFKGTSEYSAQSLADEIDRIGGQVNASTNQETLGLTAHCIDGKAPRALDLLIHMLLDSVFPDDEIRRERNVVLEEYKMYEDTPDDLIVDHFFRNLWPGSALGRPVLGTPGSIRRFSSKRIQTFLGREFVPARILITMAGSFDQAESLRIMRRRLGKLKRRPVPRLRASGSGSAPARKPGAASPARVRRTVERRPIEQVHFCIGSEGPSRTSRDRYAFAMMNLILGGSMNSRLFREVREKRGLVYSIQSFTQLYQSTGSLAVAGSTSPRSIDEVLEITLREVAEICDGGVETDELELAREQILDSLLMGLESTHTRMLRLADALLTHGHPIPYSETVEEIKGVTPAAVRRVARKYLRKQPLAGAFIGPDGVNLAPLNRFR